jgi:acyl dehydratase
MSGGTSVAPQVFRGIDELVAAVGTTIGASEWIEIDQGRVDRFADTTGDRQWIHVDVDRARSGPFGTTIAHGYLTMSLISDLAWQVYRTEGLSMEINYGANKVRFPAPVSVPSRVRAVVHLVAVEPAGHGHLVTMRVTMELEGSQKPACVAETLGYLVPA